jgi:hypothetical protein
MLLAVVTTVSNNFTISFTGVRICNPGTNGVLKTHAPVGATREITSKKELKGKDE